jgi:hypothetical protein
MALTLIPIISDIQLIQLASRVIQFHLWLCLHSSVNGLINNAETYIYDTFFNMANTVKEYI